MSACAARCSGPIGKFSTFASTASLRSMEVTRAPRSSRTSVNRPAPHPHSSTSRFESRFHSVSPKQRCNLVAEIGWRVNESSWVRRYRFHCSPK